MEFLAVLGVFVAMVAYSINKIEREERENQDKNCDTKNNEWYLFQHLIFLQLLCFYGLFILFLPINQKVVKIKELKTLQANIILGILALFAIILAIGKKQEEKKSKNEKI